MKPFLMRFSELKAENVNFDFHVHTDITDGTEPPEKMIAAAIKKNLKKIAFTEHVTRETRWYRSFIDKINYLKNNSEIVIYLGAEAKVIDFYGNIDIPADIAGIPELLVGVVHRYPDGNNGFLSLDQISELGSEQACKTEFKLLLSMIQNRQNGVDVIGHPFGVYLKYYKTFPDSLYEKILSESLKCGKAIEINTKYLLNDSALMLLKKINPYISLGSDAHTAEDIARSYDIIKNWVKK
jgi:putative hydrolase